MPYDPSYEYRVFARGDMAIYGLSGTRRRFVRVISRCFSRDGRYDSYVVDDGDETFYCTWMHLAPIGPMPVTG